MAKVTLQAGGKLLLLCAFICLSTSFRHHPASKLSECTNTGLNLIFVNKVSLASSPGSADYMEKNLASRPVG